MGRYIPLATVIVVLGMLGPAVRAESFLADFEDAGIYPIGWHLRDTDPWWGQDGASEDPTIQSGIGVADSVGISAAQDNFHWIGQPFQWKDPTVAGVVIQLDFKTPAADNSNFPFSSDSVGWTIGEFSESSNDYFQVSLSKTDSGTGLAEISGKWANATSGTGRDPVIVSYPGSLIQGYTWYRLTAQFSKLPATSGQVDVTAVEVKATLTELNPDGTLGTVIASGTIPNTNAMSDPKDVPDPALFTATTMWPTFKNYNEKASGPADNAYLEIIPQPPPDCFSKVTPDDNTINYAEADINQAAIPSSFNYLIENLGLNAFDYTVTELDDQQQPADVPWLSTSKSGGTVASMASDTVTANINTTGLAGGAYTAYLKFTDNCDPAIGHVRRIDLAVYACRWSVDSCSQERSYSTEYPNYLPQDVVYRITNTGAYPLDYTVTKTGGGDCFDWLVVTNPTGTVAVGEYVDVVATIDVNALQGHDTDDDYNCTLTFTDGCSPQAVVRNVRMRYLGPGDTHEFAYLGDVDPEEDDSAGPGMKFQPYDSDANGAVEEDYDAVDGKVWHMLDQYGIIKSWYRAYYWDGSDWDDMPIHGEGGTTMVARLKVNGWGGGTRRPIIAIDENDTSTGEFHWGGPDGVAAETKRDLEQQTGVGTSDFVILWISTKGNQPDSEWQCGQEINLYLLNDNLDVLWEMTIPAPVPKSSTRSGFFFGDNSGSAILDVAYDWISGTNVGAFAPGEEVAVLGHSLVVMEESCIIPFPDTDGDSDVDMTDFAAMQRCISPALEVTEECRCFDRDRNGFVDENDLEAFLACATGPGMILDEEHPPVNCHP